MEDEAFEPSAEEIRQQFIDDEWRILDRMVRQHEHAERVEQWLTPLTGAVASACAIGSAMTPFPVNVPFIAGLFWTTYMLATSNAWRQQRLENLERAEERYDLLRLEVQFANSPDE